MSAVTLDDFERTTFTHDGTQRDIFRRGSGPAVIVMAEMPGITPERFAVLREQLGDAFIAVELADADANPDALMPPHSVLTEHLVDEPGTPTRQALDDVLAFLARRLGVAAES